VWAVENANGLGRLLSRQLLEAGESLVDVRAKLSARVRKLSGAGHETDAHYARPTAVADPPQHRRRAGWLTTTH
jgi:transposase